MDAGEEVVCELVVACVEASEVLEPAEHALDGVSALVEHRAEAALPEPGHLGGDVGRRGQCQGKRIYLRTRQRSGETLTDFAQDFSTAGARNRSENRLYSFALTLPKVLVATVSSGGSISGPGTISGFLDIQSGGVVTDVKLPISNTIDDDGELAYGAAGPTKLQGVIAGSGQIMQNGPGALVLSGYDGNFSGEIVISGGTVELASYNAPGSSQVACEPGDSVVTLKVDSANQPYSGTTYSNTVIDFDSPSTRLDLAGVTYSADATAVITSSGGGSATLTLQDGSSYSAEFTLAGGVATQYVVGSDGHGGTLIRAKTAPSDAMGAGHRQLHRRSGRSGDALRVQPAKRARVAGGGGGRDHPASVLGGMGLCQVGAVK